MSVLIALFVFGLAFALTPAVIGLSWKIGAVDVPQDWRRMHLESVPRAGGLAIVLPFLLGCALLGESSPFLIATLCGGGLMLAVGLADDIFCLGAWSKLFFQIAAASAAVLGSGATDGMGTALGIFWVVTLTNAHNFVDGLDGLFAGCATIESLLLGLALFLVGEGGLATVAILLAVACLAFRFYNRYPAQIFAGDCGSESVGLLLGMLSLPLFSGAVLQIETLAPLLVFAYPLTDLVTAVVRRVLRGRSPFAADRAHLHHRICAAGLSCVECGGVLLAICFSLGVIGVLLCVETLWIYAIGACLASALLLFRLRKYIVGVAVG
ncbi:MAG: undecaprenyl/decaprenyl-phosphate alpha-N-acetylglucosaminyl 1-phosphate transferase [Clostridia bacterium]|nr:undecaprenyl/decaprenyl-phosphate alpha-N-acetylglucosaminyl 1-phosphate transferase [Clostridia bacterium]